MADRCKLSAAIVSDSVERSYLLKVDGFKGHDWILRYYPNGGRSEIGDSARYVSLVAECSDAIDDLPRPPIDLRDRDGEPEPPYVVSTIYSWPGCPTLSGGLSSYYRFLIDKAELEQSGDIIDDCFSIMCVLTLSEETMDDRFVVVPPSNLHLHFADLLESMDGADVTFHVAGRMFSAHRLILAARSPVFRAELLGAMKEKAGGPIEIHDMEADVFKCLLHFIYTDSLPDLQMASNQGEAHLDVMMASHLLVAADRYNIERLKLICKHKLCSHIDADMAATSLVLAEQHCCNGLKEACLQFLASPSNLEAVMTSDG
ncbi:BTB/POZ and MATH domain-containing protein 2-like [Triticum urartu]|uniref:BTB/POZ and MATH domain-containing protein 2-like n=1 Tax=Triticum urartu TaxID=4572 RepID=UPI0020437B7D|nr:BTB/POZ and MATH domain-containing protein 2-like [Triticum urartu]